MLKVFLGFCIVYLGNCGLLCLPSEANKSNRLAIGSDRFGDMFECNEATKTKQSAPTPTTRAVATTTVTVMATTTTTVVTVTATTTVTVVVTVAVSVAADYANVRSPPPPVALIHTSCG